MFENCGKYGKGVVEEAKKNTRKCHEKEGKETRGKGRGFMIGRGCYVSRFPCKLTVSRGVSKCLTNVRPFCQGYTTRMTARIECI